MAGGIERKGGGDAPAFMGRAARGCFCTQGRLHLVDSPERAAFPERSKNFEWLGRSNTKSSVLVLSGCLEIGILEAQLVRIFDSLKPNQDVFVQLVCCSGDSSGERVLGRTETCRNADVHPRWEDAKFICGRARDAPHSGDTIKFQVQVEHVVRCPVLCGEAEFSLEGLQSRARAGRQRFSAPLFKRGEQTGALQMTFAFVEAGICGATTTSPAWALDAPDPHSRLDQKRNADGIADEPRRESSQLPVGTLGATGEASPASTVYALGQSGEWWDLFIDRG